MSDKTTEAIDNLNTYINEDTFFIGKTKIESDFDKFCYNHCKDIKTLLTAYEEVKQENINLKDICKGKAIMGLGTSNLYKESK